MHYDVLSCQGLGALFFHYSALLWDVEYAGGQHLPLGKATDVEYAGGQHLPLGKATDVEYAGGQHLPLRKATDVAAVH
jgi:hypothetical protein